MILHGKASHHAHPAYILSLDANDYFKAFALVCRNRNDAFDNVVFFRKYVSHRDLVPLMAQSGDETCVIVGDMPKVPNSPEITVHLTLGHEKGRGKYVSEVRVEFPLAHYFLFYDRVKE